MLRDEKCVAGAFLKNALRVAVPATPQRPVACCAVACCADPWVEGRIFRVDESEIEGRGSKVEVEGRNIFELIFKFLKKFDFKSIILSGNNSTLNIRDIQKIGI